VAALLTEAQPGHAGRRLARRPISRSAGRFTRLFLIPKSLMSLMVVSVRSARPSHGGRPPEQHFDGLLPIPDRRLAGCPSYSGSGSCHQEHTRAVVQVSTADDARS